MLRFSLSNMRLPMRLLSAAALGVMLGFGGLASPAVAGEGGIWPTSLLHGRWRFERTYEPFTALSRPYRTIDFSPCAGGLCGVSVSDNGACGATLFRFSTGMSRPLFSQVMWGRIRKTITIEYYDRNYPGEWDGDYDPPSFQIRIGDMRDIWGNDDTNNVYEQSYIRRGQARCVAR